VCRDQLAPGRYRRPTNRDRKERGVAGWNHYGAGEVLLCCVARNRHCGEDEIKPAKGKDFSRRTGEDVSFGGRSGFTPLTDYPQGLSRAHRGWVVLKNHHVLRMSCSADARVNMGWRLRCSRSLAASVRSGGRMPSGRELQTTGLGTGKTKTFAVAVGKRGNPGETY